MPRMALPPEPLDEVKADVALAVVGRVVRAERVEVETGRRAIGAAPARPEQAIEVEVQEVLFGEAGETVSLTKPAAAYVLVEGAAGTFVADADRRLLGRQGPETWSAEAVRAAFAPKQADRR